MNEVDLYFGTFAKAMAGIGGFVAGPESVIDFSDITCVRKSTQNHYRCLCNRALKRLDLLKNQPEHRKKLWTIVNALQTVYEQKDSLGKTNSPVILFPFLQHS